MKRIIKWSSLVLLLVLAVVLATACEASEQQTAAAPSEAPAATEAEGETTAAPAPAKEVERTPFGAFATEDTAGNTVTEAVFQQANLTVLNVWATFCGYCIREMPALDALNNEFHEQGVQVLGLIGDVGDGAGGYTEEEMESVQALAEKAGAEFPTLMPSADMIDLVLRHVEGYPTTLLIDREGNVLDRAVVGAQSEADWRETIKIYLAAVAEDVA